MYALPHNYDSILFIRNKNGIFDNDMEKSVHDSFISDTPSKPVNSVMKYKNSFRTYPKNMGVAEIEQFCGLARKKNGSILFKKTYSAVFLTPPGCKRADCRQPRFLG